MEIAWRNNQFVRNSILTSLSSDDFQYIRSFLQSVIMKERSVLQEPNRQIEYVYFVETGLVSLMTLGAGNILETAMVGSYGVLPASIALGATTSTHRSMVLISGNALRIRTDDLQRSIYERPQIRENILRYVYSLMAHESQTAFCGVRHQLEQRLASWLCLVCNAIEGDILPITHDHLSNVLGFRRMGVANTLAEFEEQGLLRKMRGALQISDRDRLERKACSCHRIIANAYKNSNRADFTLLEYRADSQLI